MLPYPRGIPGIHLILVSFFLLASGLPCLCGQVVFKASADAREVVENGVFNVEYTLENAATNRFTPPVFKHFEMVSGPSRSQSTTVINGQMSQSISFSYTLLAREKGTFRIEPATVEVNGRKITSNALVIEVVRAAHGDQAAGKEVFLRAEIDSQVIFPGQQQYLYYKIYTEVNIRDYSTISEDKYDDFFFRYVKDFDRRPQKVVIDGKQYTAQVIKTVALFPQKTGTFEIDPMVLNVWVPKPGATRSRGFFRTYNHINKRISSNRVTLRVAPLPENAPASFSGGVGSFRMFAQIDERKITTDDALVLRMRVIGDGDGRRWTAPDIGLDELFEVFDPNILNDKSVDQNGSVVSDKTFEYLLIPRNSGTLNFSVPFSFFDPDSMQYVTLNSNTFTVGVSRGTNTPGTGQGPGPITAASPGIQAFRKEPGFTRFGRPFVLSPVFWVLAGIPVLGIGVFFLFEKRKEAYLRLDPARRKMMEAKRKALHHLKTADALKSAGTDEAYYEAISAAIFGYVSDKLGIPLADLSMAEIRAKVNGLRIAEEKGEQLMSILSRCQYMVYGGGGSTGQRQGIYDETLDLITVLESDLSGTG